MYIFHDGFVQRDEISPYLRDIMRSVGNLTAAQNKLSNQLAEVTNRLDTELPNTVAEIVKKEIRDAIRKM